MTVGKGKFAIFSQYGCATPLMPFGKCK